MWTGQAVSAAFLYYSEKGGAILAGLSPRGGKCPDRCNAD